MGSTTQDDWLRVTERGVLFMRSILVVLFLLYSVSLLGQDQAPTLAEPTSEKKIQVVIVGVPYFAIPEYRNKNLATQITQRCRDIQTFFKKTFKDEVEFHVRCTKEGTTRESLRTLFEGQLPHFADRTLTLIFIISHGELDESTKNDFFSPDVRLVTSNSTDPDPITWKLSTISVGTALMTWLEHVPDGSTVVTFLDTCHAGGFGSLSSTLQADLAQQYGVSMMVAASSLAQQKSYSAAFTEALLATWESGDGCITDAKWPDVIEKRIEAKVGVLDDFEGRPQIVIPFRGSICLSNLDHPSARSRLLMLYSGSSKSHFRYWIKNETDNSDLPPGYLIEKSFEFVRLKPARYNVTFKEEKGNPISKIVDLTSQPVGILFVKELAEQRSVATAYNAAASAAEKMGVPQVDVADLRKASASVFAAANDSDSVAKVLASLRKSGDEDTRLEAVRHVAFKDPKAIQDFASGQPISEEALGKTLMLAGDFANAAIVLKRSCESVNEGPARDKLALLAYFAYGAAGLAEEAKKTRLTFGLDLSNAYTVGDSLITLEEEAVRSQNVDTFRAMSTINAMKYLRQLETGDRAGTEPSREWEQHILWSVRNTDAGGAVDCTEQYVVVGPECLVDGGRSCLMRKAINAAYNNDCTQALKLSEITQCHNISAANEIMSMGPLAICDYLKSTAAAWMAENFWIGAGGTKIDYGEARKYFLLAATHGNARAMANLGWIYENGFGVAIDYSAAMAWYREAVDHRDIIAFWNIGRLYELGYGVPQDLEKAKEWYRRGAAVGDTGSQKKLQELGVPQQ
jgi:hypothetical protein